jgi:hypothetical protein
MDDAALVLQTATKFVADMGANAVPYLEQRAEIAAGLRADDYDDRMTTTTMAGLVACFG